MFRSLAIKAALCTSILLSTGLWHATGAAQSNERERAAAAFDAGVKHFDRSEYADAARSFLQADQALPSLDALDNALKSALKAKDHLLVALAARRAIAREGDSPELAARGREALLTATPKIAILEIKCEAAACRIQIDGAVVTDNPAYVLPGRRNIVAQAGDARAEESVATEAGVRYSVTLHPSRPGAAAKQADVVPVGGPSSAPSSATKDSGTDERPLSPVVFYVGAGVSAVLLGVTVWSGVDTLGAKSDLTSQSTKTEVDDVRGKALRTDILFGSTVLLSALTAYAGVALVQWDARPLAAVSEDELFLGVGGEF